MPTFDPPTGQLDFDAVPILVARFDRGKAPGSRLTLLPNIRAESIAYVEGAKPSTARLSYILSDTDPTSPWPSQFDNLWPLSCPDSPYLVRQDDELAIYGLTPANKLRCLFHGFATIPQTDLTGRSQSVTFSAVGVAIRFWDQPVGGAPMRDSDTPTVTSETAVRDTDLDVRFNPDRLPNCSPDGQDVNEGSTTANEPPYPVFMDHRRKAATNKNSFWDLGKLTRFLLATYNPNREYVDNPDFAVLDDLLQSRRPLDGSSFYDPSDPSTYLQSKVVTRDATATGEAWPDFLADQLKMAGFAFAWRTEEDENSEPYNYIEFYRLDQAIGIGPKDVTLPPTRQSLDAVFANLSAMSAVRDHNGVANSFRIQTEPQLYEVTVVLAPGFSIDAADATWANQQQFLKANLVASGKTKEYRHYVADEAGEGHWDYASSSTLAFALDLSKVFGPPDGFGKPSYVVRRRPGKNTLLSTDTNGTPFKAELAISTDFARQVPCVWDGSGTWRSCGDQGWKPLKDRLGIEIDAPNPNEWELPPKGTSGVITGDNVRGIEAQAAPTGVDSGRRFYLRYTVTIEGDKMMRAVATKRPASPSQFTTERVIDAKDHFAKWVVAAGSIYNPNVGPVSERDDTDEALAHATALRTAHEFPSYAGTLMIPSLTNAYVVGDQIRKIAGREIDLRSNAGAGQGEAPRYPCAVGVSWDFTGDGQRTSVQLSDRRAEPMAPSRSVMTGDAEGRERHL